MTRQSENRTVAEMLTLGDKAKFKDYLNLRVGGRDAYSRQKWDVLVAQISHDDQRIVDREQISFADQAKVYRWILRGLPAIMALKKIEIDNQVHMATMESSRRRDAEIFDSYDFAEFE